MKSFLLLGLLSAWFCPAWAQDTLQPARQVNRLVKFAPLALIDPDATLEVGLEQRVRAQQSVQLMAGYGWKGLSLSESELEEKKDAEVWRARLEYRWYTGRFRTNARRGIRTATVFPLGNYWALEGLFKQITYQEDWWLSRPELTGGAPLPPAILNRQYTYGLHLKVGRQIALPTTRQQVRAPLLLDLYAGVGFRANYLDNQARRVLQEYDPAMTMFERFNYDGWRFAPSVTAGLRLAFAVSKK